MIDFYTWTTPNGRKVSIMLEECALEYRVHPVNIGANEQFTPRFLHISPNNKIPAIVDHDTGGEPLSVFESGAILLYLAEKTGRFLPARNPGRAKAFEWLMWQMSSVGPMLGQANHFANQAPEPIAYAIDRFLGEGARLVRVLDRQLAASEYMAGDYSVADMATYPWISVAFGLVRSLKPDVVGEGANVERWLGAVGARAAVVRGMAIPKL
ncbi:MAG: glutathione S-transferase N-terminal domain-containing protein [Deltaproteobacteria bacterium]|nr:glutathione S-transferase N-terminal domain-containing protein [Deltaproteobacteria bacterium]